jgi:hypothetical protein
MNIPSDFATWLKVVGAASAGLGSLLLAWRAAAILKWVVYALVAHEDAIHALLTGSSSSKRPVAIGVTKHLLDVESKVGVALLVFGLGLLGIGMLANAASFFF